VKYNEYDKQQILKRLIKRTLSIENEYIHYSTVKIDNDLSPDISITSKKYAFLRWTTVVSTIELKNQLSQYKRNEAIGQLANSF